MAGKVALLVGLLFSVAACAETGCPEAGVYETYLLPEDFSGPVVVVFEQAGSKLIIGTASCEMRYEIPADGVLRVANKRPESGIYWQRFLESSAIDNEPQALSMDLPDSSRQVFGFIVGNTSMLEGQPISVVAWTAFLVGVPAETGDWHAVRREAIHRAVGDVVRHSNQDSD